jgi:hypothetical protein
MDDALSEPEPIDLVGMLDGATGRTLSPKTVDRLTALVAEFERHQPQLQTLLDAEIQAATSWRKRLTGAEAAGNRELADVARGRASELTSVVAGLEREISSRQAILERARVVLRDATR